MSNERTGLYEGMFLFPQSTTANLQVAIDHLKEILEKCNVSIINFSKWDDRRLAYEIDGNKRGVYFLVYFNAPTTMISDLERRCNQSEEILRMMVTRADHLPTEIIESNEGAEALADEIKVRGEQKSESGSSSASAVAHKENARNTTTAVENEVSDEESPNDETETNELHEQTKESEEVPEEVTEA
jgi:small subunit ribosomal protein S6